MKSLSTDEPIEGANHPMTQVISELLVVGVGLSALVLAAGLALALLTDQTGYGIPLTPELVIYRSSVAFPRTIDGILSGVTALRPFAVIELGVLLLIATPVLRVAMSVVMFLLEKDYGFVAITFTVLVLLLTSLLWLG